MVRPGIQQTTSSVYYFPQDGSDFVISLWMNPQCATILINAIEQVFPCGTVYFASEGGCNFVVCR